MLLSENFWNIVLFVPIGLLLSLLWKRRGTVILTAVLFSAFLEVSQLVTRRGLFEFDDVIHNALGAVIGVLVYRIFRRRWFS